MLHNAVVLYRRTIAFSYIASTNHESRLLRISLPHASASFTEASEKAHRPAVGAQLLAGWLVGGGANGGGVNGVLMGC